MQNCITLAAFFLVEKQGPRKEGKEKEEETSPVNFLVNIAPRYKSHKIDFD